MTDQAYSTLPFQFEMPMSVFEKASAPPGQRRRIGGIASIEVKDRQNEVLVARGLDFRDFLDNGWFNDNHSKATDGIVGYPTETRMFQKGERLPDGRVAPAPGHWVEGYLLEGHPPADRIWKLANALKKTDRRLGFSVEGKVIKRGGLHKSGGRLISKAKVRNVAITNCPVNTVAKMDILAKSLQAMNQAEPTKVEKALGMGTATGINPPPGPQTGMGAGQVITGQSLEGQPRVLWNPENSEVENENAITIAEAFRLVRDYFPEARDDQVWRILAITKQLKIQNML